VDNNQNLLLTPEELDTIGEIMNISIGASATALSTMLEKQVVITSPEIEQEQFKEIDCSDLEPALIVKIRYVEGIEGVNVTMFKRRDMQIILDLLMGNEEPVAPEDFVFDDMSMSAASEVMNQMMGSSATALSEILTKPINISAPETQLVATKDETQEAFSEIRGDEQVVSINFKMTIKGILNTTFRCFLPTALAKEVVNSVSPEDESKDVSEPVPLEPQKSPSPGAGAPNIQNSVQPPQPQSAPDAGMPMQQPAAAQQQANPYMQGQPPMMQQPAAYQQTPQPGYYPPQPQMPNGAVQYAAPAQYAAAPTQYMPQGPAAHDRQAQQTMYAEAPVNVKRAGFPDFSQKHMMDQVPYNSNMKLLMGVQLEVSVIIGRTKRRIKDIMDFGQGTVVLLDTQTGAPAEIFVNGQLLAYGDIVVVGDNFGVRITEIVGTKELIDSLYSDS